MKKITYILLVIICLFFISKATGATTNEEKELLIGKVISIEDEVQEEMTSQLGEPFYFTNQILLVKINRGSLKGKIIEIENDYVELREGENFLIVRSVTEQGDHFSYPHPLRVMPLLGLIFLFGLVIFLFTRWQGVRSFATILLSIGTIIFYVLPQINKGASPILVAIFASLFIITISLYFVYGWNKKTHAAFLGTTTGLFLTLVLSLVFVELTRLTGQGSDQAIQIKMFWGDMVNLKDLYLAAIIIGSVGALNDVAVDQSSTVFAIKKANPQLNSRDLYRQSVSVGKDHLLATINTLVLAYVSVSLPLLLIVSSSNNLPILFLLNNEVFAGEIVRTFLVSLSLLFVTPITNLFAVILASRKVKK